MAGKKRLDGGMRHKAKSEGETQRLTISSGVVQEEKIGDQDMEGSARTVLSYLL